MTVPVRAQTNPSGTPEVSPLLTRPTGVRATSAALAHVAFVEWTEQEESAGRAVGRRTWAVWRTLVKWAFTPQCRRYLERGAVRMLYDDLVDEGHKEATVGRAMRRFRAAGLLDGKPNEADPTDDWHRDPADYRVMVPALCRQLVSRLRYAAKRKLDELRAADSPRSNDRSPVPGQSARLHLERYTSSSDDRRRPVDTGPPRPIPADYRAAVDALMATKRKGWG